MVKGSPKGDGFELVVCRCLSRWSGFPGWEDTEARLLPFRRRSTNVQPVDGLWVGGADILAKPDRRWPFAGEAKKQEEWNFHQLFTGRGPVLDDWWVQTRYNAKKHGLLPLLIFSHNNAPLYYVLQESVWRQLQKSVVEKDLIPVNLFALDVSGMAVVVGAISDLIRTVPYSSVQRLSVPLTRT